MQRAARMITSEMNVVALRTLPLLLICFLGACADAPQPSDASVADDDPPAVAEDRDSRPDTTSTPSDASTAAAHLALEGAGLRVFVGATGSARPLPFGTPATEALSILETVLGAVPVERGDVADCGTEFARWENGLVAWFANGRLAGWSLRQGSPLTTASGIGLGSTRGELEAAYDVEFYRSSLGEEFTAGGLAGLLESASPDARIQHLWSGQTCIAR